MSGNCTHLDKPRGLHLTTAVSSSSKDVTKGLVLEYEVRIAHHLSIQRLDTICLKVLATPQRCVVGVQCQLQARPLQSVKYVKGQLQRQQACLRSQSLHGMHAATVQTAAFDCIGSLLMSCQVWQNMTECRWSVQEHCDLTWSGAVLNCAM